MQLYNCTSASVIVRIRLETNVYLPSLNIDEVLPLFKFITTFIGIMKVEMFGLEFCCDSFTYALSFVVILYYTFFSIINSLIFFVRKL